MDTARLSAVIARTNETDSLLALGTAQWYQSGGQINAAIEAFVRAELLQKSANATWAGSAVYLLDWFAAL